MIQNKETVDKIYITSNDFEFLGMVRLMYSPEDNNELTQSFKIILHLLEHKMPIEQVRVSRQ